MSRHIQFSRGALWHTPAKMLFLSWRYYLSGMLVSVNVLSNVVPPLIKKISSIADIDVSTCHPSVCEIPVLSSRSVHAHILNIR